MKTYEKLSDFKNKLTAKAVTLWDKEKLQKNFDKFNEFVNGTEEYMIGKDGDRLSRKVAKYYLNMFSNEIENRKNHPDWYGINEETEKSNENAVPATIEEIPIPTMSNETANCTSNAGETNVNKNLPKKSPKTIAKPKKNNYINTTNETKTTNSNGDKTMITKNEIAKIAPNAVKKILAAQKTNKTDTKKTYWGGWGKVRAGMNAAYNDYNKFQELENQWAELRSRLGKGPKGHFCWSLINKNRVGVKQEPNSTLRFIKNVKIRIAMANDVLNGKYTKTQIDEYMNGLSTAYKLKYGLV